MERTDPKATRCAWAAMLVCAACILASHSVQAQEAPRAYCARIGNDDELHKPPASLEGALKRLFHISGAYALETSYYRCANGKVMLCTIGANLPCGKANMSRRLAPADAFCRDNPNSNFIPLAVTGHDTPYDWRCIGRRAAAGAPVAKIDRRGFFAENWKVME